MDFLFIIVLVIAFILIITPPAYDPAIRWKERNERKRRRFRD